MDVFEPLVRLHYAFFFSLAIRGGSREGRVDFLVGPCEQGHWIGRMTLNSNCTFGWRGGLFTMSEKEINQKATDPRNAGRKNIAALTQTWFGKWGLRQPDTGLIQALTFGLVSHQIWHTFQSVPLEFILCFVMPCCVSHHIATGFVFSR